MRMITYDENFRGSTLLINRSFTGLSVLRTAILQEERDPTQVFHLNSEHSFYYFLQMYEACVNLCEFTEDH